MLALAWRPSSPGQTEDLRHVVLVVRGDGHVEPHRDARVLQGAEVVHHFLNMARPHSRS